MRPLLLLSACLLGLATVARASEPFEPTEAACASLYAAHAADAVALKSPSSSILPLDYELRATMMRGLAGEGADVSPKRSEDWRDAAHTCDRRWGFRPGSKFWLRQPDVLHCSVVLAILSQENASDPNSGPALKAALSSASNGVGADHPRANAVFQSDVYPRFTERLNTARANGAYTGILSGIDPDAVVQACVDAYKPGGSHYHQPPLSYTPDKSAASKPQPAPKAPLDRAEVCDMIGTLTRAATGYSTPFSNLSRGEYGFGFTAVSNVFDGRYSCEASDTDPVYGMDYGFTRLSCLSREDMVTPKNAKTRDAVFAPARAERDRLNDVVKTCLKEDDWSYMEPVVDLNYGTSWEDHVYTNRRTGVTVRVSARRGDDPDALRYGRRSTGFVHRHGFAVDSPAQ